MKTKKGVKMATAALQTVRNAVIALALTASLAVGSLGLASSAEARIEGPRETPLARACGYLQDEFDKWRGRYATAPAGSLGQTKAFQMMHYLAAAWDDRGCGEVYGLIS